MENPGNINTAQKIHALKVDRGYKQEISAEESGGSWDMKFEIAYRKYRHGENSGSHQHCTTLELWETNSQCKMHSTQITTSTIRVKNGCTDIKTVKTLNWNNLLILAKLFWDMHHYLLGTNVAGLD